MPEEENYDPKSGKAKPGEYTTSPDPGKEVAKMNRYMDLDLATKLTQKTKDRLERQRIANKKRIDAYLDKMRNR